MEQWDAKDHDFPIADLDARFAVGPRPTRTGSVQGDVLT